MLQSIYCLHFYCKRRLSLYFRPRYESLKLNHDTNYLMTSETRLKIRWLIFNFIKTARAFSFRVTVHLLFSFLLQKAHESIFLPRYESLKLNHDTYYLMTSEDTVVDPLMSVQFYIKSKSFIVTCFSPSTVFTFIAKEAWICISTTLWIFKHKRWHKLFDDFWRHGWRSVG